MGRGTQRNGRMNVGSCLLSLLFGSLESLVVVLGVGLLAETESPVSKKKSSVFKRRRPFKWFPRSGKGGLCVFHGTSLVGVPLFK